LLPVQQQNAASTATTTRIDLRIEGAPLSLRCASRGAIGTSVRTDPQRRLTVRGLRALPTPWSASSPTGRSHFVGGHEAEGALCGVTAHHARPVAVLLGVVGPVDRRVGIGSRRVLEGHVTCVPAGPDPASWAATLEQTERTSATGRP
jgi:hypothetical protein